jgi:hypothetical protein
MGHAGFDRLTYPGDDMMQLLYDKTNLSWTGFYLAPAPSQPYAGWMTKEPYSNYDCDWVVEGSTDFVTLGAIA